MIILERVEKLGHHKQAYALGLRICGDLVGAGMFLWGPSWDVTCIVAMDGLKCAGYLEYSKDEDEDFLKVDFVCIDPAYRKGGQVFILLLAQIKQICLERNIQKIRFDYHPNNPLMKDAVRILNARIHVIRAEINLSLDKES